MYLEGEYYFESKSNKSHLVVVQGSKRKATE